MKIPQGMTQQQTIDQINVVVNRIAPKYTFKGYEVEDIKQEAFMICMDALDRYDANRPLENFLSVHLSNRLKNFVRDNYFVKDDEDKKRVLSPKQLTLEHDVSYEEKDGGLQLDLSEIKSIIDKFLPVEYRSDYLKYLNGVHIPKKRKVVLIQVIKDLLEENGYA